ncbi:hypothetical protein HT031_004037 [Scenedesmus sp. PABB004]|nr:hypothetical protein HT031_004037 [Scenedesmus sp. PABB004]
MQALAQRAPGRALPCRTHGRAWPRRRGLGAAAAARGRAATGAPARSPGRPAPPSRAPSSSSSSSGRDESGSAAPCAPAAAQRWAAASSLLLGGAGSGGALLGVAAAAGAGALGSGFQLEGPASVAQALGVLAAIIAVHEAGHFTAARAQGIHVTQFAIGFGPPLFSFKRGEVEYSLRAIPLGGYVAFPDDDPQNSSYAPDDPDLLQNRSVPERALVISAGVIANVVFALAVLFAQVNVVGKAQTSYLPGVLVPEVTPGGVAAAAGFQPGDVILRVGDFEVPANPGQVPDVVAAIKAHPGEALPFRVQRGEGVLDLSATPAAGRDGRGAIGVSLFSHTFIKHTLPASLPDAAGMAGAEFARLGSTVLGGLASIVTNFGAASAQLSGPVAIVAAGSEIARADAAGLYQFAAIVNINLAVVNTLPLPALDGGYLLLLGLEAARGRKLPAGLEQGFMASGLLLMLALGVGLAVRDTINLLMAEKVPVTVVTGFLGAGKTTLVNHILKGNHGKRIAVIENEFGEVGIDDALVVETKEEIYEMNNGCVCCTVRGDLIRILAKLLRRKAKFDAIMIETTGLANPAPVIQTFFVDDDLKDALALDAVLTLVDAKHVTQHLDDVKPDGVVNEAVQQVAFADKLLLNKVDLVSPEDKAAVVRRLRGINRSAEVIECSHAAVDLARVLGIQSFSMDRMLEMDPDFLEDDEPHHHGHGHGHDHGHDYNHADGHDHGHDHGHGGHGHGHGDGHGEHHHGHHLDHKHDDRVTSVGIVAEGSVDMAKLNAWLSGLLQERGADIFRSKGVLSIEGSPHKHVFQGVHMLLQFSSSAEGAGRPWREGEPRYCKLVFIGKNLDRAELNAAFDACRVPAAAA